MKATTKDLRLHTSELLAATDRGESVIITYRGSRRAILRRWEAETKKNGELNAGARNPAFGIWADESGDVEAQVRCLRQRRPLP